MGTYNDVDPTPLNSGWQQTFFDGFNGSGVDRDNWPVLYGGQAGNKAYHWSPNDVQVRDGELQVQMTRHGDGSWTAGGVSQGWEGQTYGLFEVRAKVDQGHGTGPGIMLWPTDNGWPPEIDLLETNQGNRGSAVFSHHWEDQGHQYASRDFKVDASQWHTYAVDWQPDRLTYYIDGQKMYETSEGVPQEKMALGFMGFVAGGNDQWYGGGPNGSTPGQVTLHIDWARISEHGAGGGVAVQTPVASAAVAVQSGYTPGQYTHADGSIDWAGASAALFGTTDGHIDWNGLSAQVTANHAATGHWIL